MTATYELIGETPCWVAGGWIRDRVIGRLPPDLDLVITGDSTSAEAPAQRLGRVHGVRAHLLGTPPRAVWRIQSASFRVELWPLGDLTPEEDAIRRDFTCNALLWRLPNGPLLDPCGGLCDIHDKTVRAVSRDNLVADPVRLLRGPRFVASLPGFLVERQTASWIGELAPLLEKAPKERLGAELLTMASGPDAGRGIMLAHDLGLLGAAGPHRHYEPDLDALRRLTGTLPHPVPAAARAAGGNVLLAWLLSAWGVRTAHGLAPYAWARPMVQDLVRAVGRRQDALKLVASAPADRREVIARAAQAFPVVLALAAATDPMAEAHALSWRRWWRQWLRSGSAILEARSPIGPEEVATTLGLQPGPELGHVLRDLHTAVIRSEIRSASGARKWLRAYSGGGESV